MKRIICAMKYVGGACTAIAVSVLWWLSLTSSAAAISSSLVISQIQLGGSGAADQEFIEFHNNTDAEVNVTDWCLVYSDYDDAPRIPLVCLTKPETADELRVPAYGNVLAASQAYVFPSEITNGERFTANPGMSGTRGHIRLQNAEGEEIDKVAWDKLSTPELNPEGIAALPPAAGKAIARTGTDILIDTDNNQADFNEQLSVPHNSDLFEYVAPKPVVDLCQLDGIQTVLPDGYGFDEAGNCELLTSDVCLNVDKIQLTYPEGMLADELHNCFIDVCTNLDGLQAVLPSGYRQDMNTCTKLEDRSLLLSELLPNASGTDTGQEYIEIYNPNDTFVALDGYTLKIGKTFEKTFHIIPEGSDDVIEAHAYLTFSDDLLGFTLLNTSSGVQLLTPAGRIASQTSYTDPKDDMAWALLPDGWSYTNRPTPGVANLPNLIEQDVESSVSVAPPSPCPAGKYRHPVTNRCRNIEADAAVLASCDADEYRSPDTNRCRKFAVLATATLAPCSEGYERNPETHRCRKAGAELAATLKPCEAGYERNPETNRCRVATPASQNLASTNTQAPAPTSFNWPAVGAVSTVAVGYAFYEWRREFTQGLKIMAGIFGRNTPH